jgi:dTDP-4-dehydrorhamnose 3,5-epimerase
LKISETNIGGLYLLDLPVHGDARGWFKENFQRAKMTVANLASGSGEATANVLPDFKIVQNNISFNAQRGVTRGIHAEPWDKYISVATGKIFGAWVDLRADSNTYGEVFTAEITPDKAIFVPRGVGNSFQALEDNTAYTYLVNDHWSAEHQSKYVFLNLADKSLGIQWPISLDSPEAIISEKDSVAPMLEDISPMLPKSTLVIGASGQLGQAVRDFVNRNSVQNGGSLHPETFIYADVNPGDDTIEFNALDEKAYAELGLSSIGRIINCAAYTNVDEAQTIVGRRLSWGLNASLPALLAKLSSEYDIELVHISSDYVFDGQLCHHPSGVPCNERCQYVEDSDYAPLGVYGQSKAAGDIAVSNTPKHYIIRVSWLIGGGNNFVKTMYNLAQKGVEPKVVSDQYGRLTFVDTVVEGIFHLFDSSSPYGAYNLTNLGGKSNWASLAKRIFELAGKSADSVTPVTTEAYFEGSTKIIAPRPENSMLSLHKICNTGFTPERWEDKLEAYVQDLKEAK